MQDTNPTRQMVGPAAAPGKQDTLPSSNLMDFDWREQLPPPLPPPSRPHYNTHFHPFLSASPPLIPIQV